MYIKRKGQFEFFAIIALVVIALIIVVFAYQLPGPTQIPTDIESQHSVVKELVLKTGRDGAYKTIETMEAAV